jgi:ACR3 family arsenite efflux pump ArsB
LEFVLFLHVLGALSVGFYLLLPFAAARLGKLPAQEQPGSAKLLYTLNRYGQWLLVVQFLTGGYLISKFPLSVAWMVVTIVIFIILGASAGMIGAPLRRMSNAGGAASGKDLSKLNMFSAIAFITMLLVLILMYLPQFGVWGTK